MLNVLSLIKFAAYSDKTTIVKLCTPGVITSMKCCKATEEYSNVEFPLYGPTRVNGLVNRASSIMK